MCFKAFALTGRIADCLYTQGVALGYELLPLQGVLLWAAWPSGRAAYMGLLPFQGVLLWVAWPSGCAAMGFLAFRACWFCELNIKH